MLQWFRALMPKEDRFFDLFERHAALVAAGAEGLRAALQGGPDFERHVKTVMDRENDADAVTAEVLDAVRRVFITPFDRSDITDLVTSMDDAIDEMRKTIKAVLLFNVTQFEPEMRDMAERILQGALVVQKLVPMLRSVGTHAGEISRLAERMSEIEGETDDIHDAARQRLFRKGPAHAVEFWVAAEILNHLERVMDRLEDVAHEIHGIVIEHV